MPSASITISDNEDGTIQVGADFGDKLEPESQAHGLIYTLLQSVLANGRNVQTIEDTAGDLNGQSAEPSPIILPN